MGLALPPSTGAHSAGGTDTEPCSALHWTASTKAILSGSDTMTEHIEQAHWEAFLDDMAKKYHGFEARIEIIGRDFGDQEMAAWLPFSGMSYDPHHRQIFVTVGGISSHYPVHLTHT